MAVRLGINGMGRIGRRVFRIALFDEDLELVGVNDMTEREIIVHLIKYDSIYGTFRQRIELQGTDIIIGPKKVKCFSEKDPERLPWKDLGTDVVLESTGKFRDKDGAGKHLKAGAKKVIISAPATGEDITIVMGVNQDKYDPANHHIISNASCTTNCLAPVLKVINDNFKVQVGYVTTVHSYTNDQELLDLAHKDPRRARAAGMNIIPTTTGAAKAVAAVLPELSGKIDGTSLRVPTPTVSIIDVSAVVEKTTDANTINQKFLEASKREMKGILSITSEPLVSSDFRGNPYSAIVDGLTTQVVGGNLVKVFAWYDNEFAYSVRCAEVAKLVGRAL